MKWYIPWAVDLMSFPARMKAKNKKVDYRYDKKMFIFSSVLFLKPNGDHLQTVANWLQDGTIHTMVEKVYPFDQVNEAFAHLETGRVTGKIVVQISNLSQEGENGKQEK